MLREKCINAWFLMILQSFKANLELLKIKMMFLNFRKSCDKDNERSYCGLLLTAKP